MRIGSLCNSVRTQVSDPAPFKTDIRHPAITAALREAKRGGRPVTACASVKAAANPRAFAESCYQLVHSPRWAGVFDGIDIEVTN